MKPLPTEFRKFGFNLRLVVRSGDVAIFERRAEHHKQAHYEVVIIDAHGGYSIGGKTVEPAEYYPSSESWGVRGWTYATRDDACRKFDALLGLPFRMGGNAKTAVETSGEGQDSGRAGKPLE